MMGWYVLIIMGLIGLAYICLRKSEPYEESLQKIDGIPKTSSKKYDTSTKEWEVLSCRYCFDLETRKWMWRWSPYWSHHKYYATEKDAEMALYHLRRSYSSHYDFGELINPPHNRRPPTRNLIRYRIVKRNLVNN